MRRALVTLGLATVVAGGTVAAFGPLRAADRPPVAAAPALTLNTLVEAAQRKTRAVPHDPDAWAQLGTAYVEQARLTADPALYGKADGAFATSLRLRPEGNLAALVGKGALAVARHEFGQARDHALKARAIDDRHVPLYGVLSDAALNLGDYRQAESALQRMLDLGPNLSSFLRAAQFFELTGRPTRADEAIALAMDAAVMPSDVALTWFRKGELAWHRGRPAEASAAYAETLGIAPGFAPALAARARVAAALGNNDAALADYAASIARYPNPGVIVELGELHQRLGDSAQAARQFSLAGSVLRLSGDRLGLGWFEAEHGEAARAVQLLRQEYRHRESVEVADALAWALHRAGRDREALGFAVKAARMGSKDALFAYHRGEIERALGDVRAARRSFRAALAANPYVAGADEMRRWMA